MNDNELIQLYFERDEQAISETERRFGGYFYTIAHNILGCVQDAEECVNDVLMRLWEHIPPAKPDNVYAYFIAVARSVARRKYKMNHTRKRGGGETQVVLDELYDCCSESDSVEAQVDKNALCDAINAFLGTLNPEHRTIFILRYWYVYTVEEITEKLGISKSKVTVTLMRTRQKLRKYLEQEGFL